VTERRDHYSYTVYADPATARTFDERRFGGPIGDLVASGQARVLAQFLGAVSGQSVLDVGTGTGRAAFLMAASGARVTGVDASEEMLAIARERARAERGQVEFLSGDAHALSFPDRSFDVAVSLRVLMHTPRWQQCVDELCRVSRHLVILDYPSMRSVALLQSLARAVSHAVGVRTEPYRVFSDSQIAQAIARNGFRIRQVDRQFVMPIALHKAIGSRSFTRGSERLLARLGLRRLLGSPVTIVAERCASS
jgi:2-polyprenyl-3-methyl-5-hydroxy-6-metoxy-1,4-benzoquinol methylase